MNTVPQKNRTACDFQQIFSFSPKKCKLPSAQPDQERSVWSHSTMKLSIINTSICILASCAHTVCFSWCRVNGWSVRVIMSFFCSGLFSQAHIGFTYALWVDRAVTDDYFIMGKIQNTSFLVNFCSQTMRSFDTSWWIALICVH